MRVVVIGATGNAGTALLRRLRTEPDLDVAGVARRLPGPDGRDDAVEWHSADVADDDLTPILHGADAVINLAWQIQPSHDVRQLFRTNVLGSRAVARAALATGVRTLVQASSVGVYSPGPKDAFVTEDHPREGIAGSSYSRHKAQVERMLDGITGMRVVRVRPGLILQRAAGTEIARYFAGPLLPTRLLRPQRLPLVPSHPRLRAQAVHADDVADAYARVLRSDLRGGLNLAAGPVLDARVAARLLRGVPVPVPTGLLTGAAALSWALRLQPVDAGWVRLGLGVPLMSCDRAEAELGWHPRHDAAETLRELIGGMADGAGAATPPLSTDPGLPGRPGGLLRGRLPGTGNPY